MGGRTNDDSQIRDLIPVFRRAMADIPGVIAIVTQSSLFQRGLGEGRNIDIEITGPELDTLVALGRQIFGQVREVLPGAQVRPKPSLDLGSPEVRINLKRHRAADVQMTNQELGFIIDALVDGTKASDYQFEGDEIDLTIRGVDHYADRTQELENLPIYTRSGKLTTVGDIADVKLVAGPEQINHIERERAITIQVIPSGQMPLETAMDLIEQQVLLPLKEGGSLGRLYHIQLSGAADELTNTYDALKYNFLLALLITYLLMAALFESFVYPFVIIFSVPLAAAGGILGLYLVNLFVAYQPLDVLTMLGFIILIGVVVNNAILVVHQALNFMDPNRRNLSMSGEGLINHIERERAITIQVIPSGQMPLETAMDLIEQQVLLPLKEGGSLGRLYHIQLSGAADELTNTYDALKYNFLLALLITYLLMAALFESFVYPFVIIFSVPLATNFTMQIGRKSWRTCRSIHEVGD